RGGQRPIVREGRSAGVVVGDAAEGQKRERQTEKQGGEQEERDETRPRKRQGAPSGTRRWRIPLDQDRGGVAHDRLFRGGLLDVRADHRVPLGGDQGLGLRVLVRGGIDR